MKSTLASLVALAAMLPGVSVGADLDLSLGGAVSYDPNVYRSAANKQSDVLFRATPALHLGETRERLDYDVRFGMPFERGIKTYTKLEFDYTPEASVGYQLTDRIRWFANDQFRYTTIPSQDQEPETDAGGEILAVSNAGNEDVTQNRFASGFTHRLGENLVSTFTLSHELFDSTDPERSDNDTVGANLNFRYVMNGRNSFTAGTGYSRETFDTRVGFPGSTTDFYSVSASWTYRIDEMTTFTIALAPNYVSSSQDRPPSAVVAVPYPVTEVEASGVTTNDWVNPETGVVQPGTTLIPEGSLVFQYFDSCPVLRDAPSTHVFNVNSTCGQRLLLNDPLNYPNQAAAIAAIDAANAGFIEATFVDDPQSDSKQTFTLFGNAALRRAWSPYLSSALNYSRRQSTASGLGGSTAVDSVSLTNNWLISELWTLGVRADWTQRKSLFPQNRTFLAAADDSLFGIMGIASRVDGPGGLVSAEVDNNVDTVSWTAAASLDRKLSPNLTSSLDGRYVKQTSTQGSSGSSSDFDTWIVSLTVTYHFQPIQLW